MKKIYLILLLGLITNLSFSQSEYSDKSTADVYLLTCSSGEESYSMYGHSAIRIVDTLSGLDEIYNWGIFDFSTPNFSYKFARGRLDYLLGINSLNSFLRDYFIEERSVVSQKINLNGEQLSKLRILLAENLLEENRAYRYDFFMDNCATRIRDILERSIGENLIYPDYDKKSVPTYRERIDDYHRVQFPWLDVGIDLLLGSPADDDCGFRESMFLPEYLMLNLSEANIKTENGEFPLLEVPVTLLSFDKPPLSDPIIKRPWFILSIISVVLIFATFRIKINWLQNLFDIVFFGSMILLSFLMVFTNYLTDHLAMGTNFNMIWLNPLLIFAPVIVLLKKRNQLFWRIQVFSILVFMVVIVLIKQAINPAFIPIMLLLLARSWYRLNNTPVETLKR